MQNLNKLPNITQLSQPDLDSPIRRRNLSLGSYQQSQISKQVPYNFRLQTLSRCYSKKNKILIKNEKIKKDLTKMCQQNIEQYLLYKKQAKKQRKDVKVIKQKRLRDEFKPIIKNRYKGICQVQPKYSIKLLNIPINVSFAPFNLSFRNKIDHLEGSQYKLRIRTQPSPQPLTFTTRRKNISLIQQRITPISPKKYKEMTLGQIVQSEDQQRHGIYYRVHDFRKRISLRTERQFQKDNQPLMGW